MTDDNVIRPDVWTRRIMQEPDASEISDADDPRATEKRHRERDRLKLEQILARRNPLLRFSDKDKICAARALGKMVHEVCYEKQITVLSLRHNNEKIYRYMLDEDSSEAKTQTLPTIVWSYLQQAQKIAAATNFDQKALQIRVLRKTALWQGWDERTQKSTDLDERAENLAILIQHLSDRVMRGTQLKQLFSDMRRESGQWDIIEKVFRPTAYGPFYHTAYQDYSEVWEEAPPLPSVALLRVWHSGFEMPMLLMDEIPESETRSEAQTPQGDEIQGEVHLYRELRLALGPTIDEATVGPLFESRAYAVVAIPDADAKIEAPVAQPSLWGLAEQVVTIQMGGKQRYVRPLLGAYGTEWDDDGEDAGHALLNWDFTPVGPKRDYADHYNVSWTAADAPYVSYWLDRRVEEFRLLVGGEGVSHEETWFPMGTAGRLVELAIRDGLLEAALKAEIEHIQKEFRIHSKKRRDKLRAETAELIARFDETADMSSEELPDHE